MVKVTYIGTSHFREFPKEALETVGVVDQNSVIWDRDSGEAQEISEAMWTYLQTTDEAPFFKLEAPESPPLSSRRIRDNPQA